MKIKSSTSGSVEFVWMGLDRPTRSIRPGRVVQSWVKITQSQCEIWIQIWKLKKHFGIGPQVDDWKL